jgi:hypothetical protein
MAFGLFELPGSIMTDATTSIGVMAEPARTGIRIGRVAENGLATDRRSVSVMARRVPRRSGMNSDRGGGLPGHPGLVSTQKSRTSPGDVAQKARVMVPTVGLAAGTERPSADGRRMLPYL